MRTRFSDMFFTIVSSMIMTWGVYMVFWMDDTTNGLLTIILAVVIHLPVAMRDKT